ncbi:DUF3141 domain-containing protein [Vogesella oryzae]|uniref:DUF3141 domain-containing protein n=1 Tax=Vogesella oryzae TaxID=1735285 RepID=UPI001583EC05|nr:DUF3141 domain-containing protein [Vogesella oryzae]
MPSATLFHDLNAYLADAWQRSILTLDVLRERGDVYLEHHADGKPPVLAFDYSIIMDGRKLPQPVNYALAAIQPPPGSPATDPDKRPFVVIDPRAGHGPGIGGFKMDSEIGIALRQGHPCYFVMFFPQPEPGQTIECVLQAEKAFLDRINSLHHGHSGKPFVIGNCQGGWALALLAATAPDKVGPILLAGSPLAYWSGVQGKHPLRYSGGLTGGTWGASLAGDLGGGLFDGAHLVSNFENLDPANTLWKKPYRLYAQVDSERERFLEFERWWGGHFMLGKQEMEWITQNLFVGNHLAAGDIELEQGNSRVDLRNIRSPIIVFASWGDNITPPQQALNWVMDLYHSSDEIRANEQTIVYCLHEQVGHLGIFVSAGVANREHSELASALDLIDVLPPGLYEAVITDTHPETPGLDYLQGRYLVRFEPREIADIAALDDGRDDEQAFEVVRRVAEINQQLYDSFVSPWLRALIKPAQAEALRVLHPARQERLWLSSYNPWLAWLPRTAAQVRSQRRPVAADNLFWQWQQQGSKLVAEALEQWGEWRDHCFEQTFQLLYGAPWLRAAVGLPPAAGWQREAQSGRWEREEMLRLKRAELEQHYTAGSPFDGLLRLLVYTAIGTGVVDVRPFNAIRRLMSETPLGEGVALPALKDSIRRQTWLVRNDAERALDTLGSLLIEPQQRQHALDLAWHLLGIAGQISEEKQARLARVAAALQLAGPSPQAGEVQQAATSAEPATTPAAVATPPAADSVAPKPARQPAARRAPPASKPAAKPASSNAAKPATTRSRRKPAPDAE